MALRRMVPCNFLKDPDIMNLASKEVQMILIGLILAADDEGRGVAHTALLSREFDSSPQFIEQSLQQIEENDLLVLYQVGRHRYYKLTRWNDWQSIAPSKLIPSKYPAPPTANSEAGPPDVPVDGSEMHAGLHDADEMQTNGCEVQTDGCNGSAQDNIREFKRREVEGALRSADADVSDDNGRIQVLCQQIATILSLPHDAALDRLIEEYYLSPHLSLLGEADAAHAWIHNPERNKNKTPISLAFFRRWLKREHEAGSKRQQEQRARESPPASNGSTAPPAAARTNLMNLEQQYQADYQRRAKEG